MRDAECQTNGRSRPLNKPNFRLKLGQPIPPLAKKANQSTQSKVVPKLSKGYSELLDKPQNLQ